LYAFENLTMKTLMSVLVAVCLSIDRHDKILRKKKNNNYYYICFINLIHLC